MKQETSKKMFRLFNLLHVYDLVATSARTRCPATAATAASG